MPGEREQEQPFNQIVTVHLDDGRIVESYIDELPRDAISEGPPLGVEPKEYEEVEEGERPREKIHPELRTLLDERAADDRAQILFALGDDMTLPRFPEPARDEPRESETNRRVMQRSEELIREITNRRAGNYERVTRELSERTRELSESYEFEVLETYWLLNAMLVELPLGAVSDLAEREDVMSVEPRYIRVLPDYEGEDELPVEPRYTREQPGESGDAVDTREHDARLFRPDLALGRRRINSDAYFDYIPEFPRGLHVVGLLDSGVRFTHQLFNNPDRFGPGAIRGDCVDGGTDCLTGPNWNPNDIVNHGTRVAGIFCANSNLGDENRGVTRSQLDSWKFITRQAGSTASFGDLRAFLLAFQNAVRVGNRIVVFAAGAPNSDDLSVVARTADNAFYAGVATIAGVGRSGQVGQVSAPANAHHVIGVGAVDVNTGKTPTNQSRGPTRDGRVKPDIQAPTGVFTATNASDTDVSGTIAPFDGTSPAAAFAAGAAALARAFISSRLPSPHVVDPGLIYAFLILSGHRAYPAFHQIVTDPPIHPFGAGQVFMPPINLRGMPTIQEGSSGEAVKVLQRALLRAGFDPGPVDGEFGPVTTAAVRSYQAARGLVVDGIVGRQTWSRLPLEPGTGRVNFWFGKVRVGPTFFDPYITIPLPMGSHGGAGFRVIDAAIWWPEAPFLSHGRFPSLREVHNDVDLHILNPRGEIFFGEPLGSSPATSTAVLSVFERAQVTAFPLEPGDWKLQIAPYSSFEGGEPAGKTQTVYWAAHAQE